MGRWCWSADSTLEHAPVERSAGTSKWSYRTLNEQAWRARLVYCRIPSGDTIEQLRHDFPGHLAMHVCQAEIAATVSEREPLVVEAHQVQHRGVQVVDMHPILDRLEAEFVGGTVHGSALDPAAGQPHAETETVMVAPRGTL